jgi:hypothetical protein
MATSFFSNPPNDTLVAVLMQLKRISETTQDLTSCSLLSQRWHEATTLFLYGHVALKQDGLIKFCEAFEGAKYGASVHSLTISSEPYEDHESTTRLVP